MIELAQTTTADVPLIMAMEQSADTREFIIPYSFEDHSRCISDPALVCLQILNHAVPVGFFILGLDRDGVSVEFRRIVVSTKGQGIGQVAIPLMERYCRDVLCRSRIWLDVFEHNRRGRHIYEKLGYQRFGERVHNGKPLLLYQKQL